jgi:hypothetical protein
MFFAGADRYRGRGAEKAHALHNGNPHNAWHSNRRLTSRARMKTEGTQASWQDACATQRD